LVGGIALIVTIIIIVVVLVRRKRKDVNGGNWWLRGVPMGDSTYTNYGSLGGSDEVGKGSMINTGTGDTGNLVSWNTQPQNEQEQEVFASMLYGDVNRKPK
jgi:hypothetical protein